MNHSPEALHAAPPPTHRIALIAMAAVCLLAAVLVQRLRPDAILIAGVLGGFAACCAAFALAYGRLLDRADDPRRGGA